MFVNNVWHLSCDLNFNTEDRNVHSLTWFVSEYKTDTVSIQTQEIWHEESDQECMFQDMQQIA